VATSHVSPPSWLWATVPPLSARTTSSPLADIVLKYTLEPTPATDLVSQVTPESVLRRTVLRATASQALPATTTGLGSWLNTGR